jgi:hypothetical protein
VPATTKSAAAQATAGPAALGASMHGANPAPQRLELAADAVDVATAERAAKVIVRRKGSTHGAAGFTWWTESGTAKPGVDFVPVMPHLERIADGENSAALSITLLNMPRSQAKSFYVVIDRAESGPVVSGRTLTMVSLQPPAAP